MSSPRLIDALGALAAKPLSDDGKGALRDDVMTLLRSSAEIDAWMKDAGGIDDVRASALPDALIAKARETGPEDALAWLARIRATREADAVHVMPVWGIRWTTGTPQRIDLSDKVALVPFHLIKNTPQQQRWEVHRGHPTLTYTLIRPHYALIAFTTIRPVLASLGRRRLQQTYRKTWTLLKDVRLCLSLIRPGAIVPGMHWDQFNDDDFIPLNEGALDYPAGDIYPQVLQPSQALDLSDADQLEAASSVVKGYLSLAAKDQDAMRLVLDRFGRALIRHDPGDAAVELSIALEGLLGGGRLIISRRAALVMGGTEGERLERRSLFLEIYKLRNTMVHTGKTPRANLKIRMADAEHSVPIETLVDMGVADTARIITAMIKRGGKPKSWEEAEVLASAG